jgi:flagellar biosynthetic protein FlhB
MADEEQDQKTEAPTGKRLGEARERGQLPISREISAWCSLLGILVVIGLIGPGALENMMTVLRVFIEAPHSMSLDDHNIQTTILKLFVQIGMAVGLIFLIMVSAVVIGIMSQTGLFASFELIKPDFMRLSWASGLKRLFSIHAVFEIGKSLCKLFILGWLAYTTVKPLIDDMPSLTGGDLMLVMGYLHHQAVHLLIVLLMVFTLIAVADWYFTRYQYIKNLRMTKTEVKDEYRQQEGDPIVKGRLRQIRMEKARKRMMAQVPKADVIITNPTHYAVAMQYDNTKMAAPVVLAKGIDRIAERIRVLAEENKIPLVSNPPLARVLYETVEIDEEIPSQHYRAVAEIISYIYKLKNRKF